MCATKRFMLIVPFYVLLCVPLAQAQPPRDTQPPRDRRPEAQATAQQGQASPAVGGVGTPGQIAKFISAEDIGDSVITEANGLIGIGTTAPARRFEISDSSPDGSFRLGNTATGGRIFEILSTASDCSRTLACSGLNIFDFTANTARMVITSTGNVGVGTTSPQSRLHVSGGLFEDGTVVLGESTGILGTGVQGQGRYGVAGLGISSAGTGVFGVAGGLNGIGVWGWGGPDNGYAGFFTGKVHVAGHLTKSSGSFKIDHPLDPANKYLSHSFVESPDMMNIYNGNVTTDDSGAATISLPAYLEALNRDFRYQLTVIGQFAQAVVASKIRDSRFTIKTDKPNVEVSWQVTGIRQDPWADKHPIAVEEDKPASERGHYLHPELYNAREEKGIEWARQSESMRQMKEQREKAQREKAQQPHP